MTADELPNGMTSGQSCTTVCINPAIYLPWLASQALKRGATIKRAVVRHVADAANLHHSGKRADVVVNCSGLGSLSLGGVQDDTMYPIRGQTVVVRNDPGHIASTAVKDSTGEVTYILPRASGELSLPFHFSLFTATRTELTTHQAEALFLGVATKMGIGILRSTQTWQSE